MSESNGSGYSGSSDDELPVAVMLAKTQRAAEEKRQQQRKLTAEEKRRHWGRSAGLYIKVKAAKRARLLEAFQRGDLKALDELEQDLIRSTVVVPGGITLAQVQAMKTRSGAGVAGGTVGAAMAAAVASDPAPPAAVPAKASAVAAKKAAAAAAKKAAAAAAKKTVSVVAKKTAPAAAEPAPVPVPMVGASEVPRKRGRPAGVKNSKGKAPKIKTISTNYTATEDICISKAVVAATLDPTRGTSQKSEEYWGKIHENFRKFMEKEDRATLMEKNRAPKSLKDRFDRQIIKKVQAFNPFYIRAKRLDKSGWQDPDYMKEALKKYQEEVKAPFLYEECAKVLWQLPKFSWEVPLAQAIVEEGGDGGTVAHSRIGSIQGGNMERPIGSKAAKRQKITDGWRDQVEDKRIAERKEANRSLKAISGSQIGMTVTYSMQDESDSRRGLIKLYQSFGRVDDVKRLLAEEEALLEEKKKTRIARQVANEQVLRKLQGPIVVEESHHGDEGPPLSVAVQPGTGSPSSEMSRSEALVLRTHVSRDDVDDSMDTEDAIAE